MLEPDISIKRQPENECLFRLQHYISIDVYRRTAKKPEIGAST